MIFLRQKDNYRAQPRVLFFLFSFVILSGCTEPFEIESTEIQDFLVINATITDQVKNQKVLLSRTFGFDEEDPVFEEGAVVKIIEDGTITYTFNETSPGTYQSIQGFGVTSGKEYQLNVQTPDGKSYNSEKVIAPKPTSIDKLYAKRMINKAGVEGVGILLDTFDATGNSLYYRFEFEETNRVTASHWISKDLITDNSTGTITFGLANRPEEQKVCYSTRSSNSINITNTKGLTEDRIQDLLINFIPSDDIRVADRYSILVKQYVQTREANGFYKVLNDFSGTENIFTQIQPGSIIGNINSENQVDNDVVGFFDVSTIAEKRIFFNREEIIEDLPAFAPDCEEIIVKRARLEGDEEFRNRLNGLIILNRIRLFVVPSFPITQLSVLTFVPRPCGDCTDIGDADVPEFWVD